jgi:hypothetical protein
VYNVTKGQWATTPAGFLGYKMQKDSIIVSHAGHTTINHSLLQVVNFAITE